MRFDLKFLLFCGFVGAAFLLFGCSPSEINQTQRLNNILRSGNEALHHKQYNQALEFYDSGLAVVPRDPVFLLNKSVALRMRGIERYNASILVADIKIRADEIEISKNDFREAAVNSTAAIERFNEITPGDFILDAPETNWQNSRANHFETMRLCATVADQWQADAALQAAHNYLAQETDQEKKLKVRLETGKMLIDTFNGARAIEEYQQVLNENPNQPDALFGIGLALSQSGQTEDLLNARRYLIKFLRQTPATDKSAAIAREILNTMPAGN